MPLHVIKLAFQYYLKHSFLPKNTRKSCSNISLTVPLQCSRTCAVCIIRNKELTTLIPNGGKKIPISSLGLSVMCKVQIKAAGWLAKGAPCLHAIAIFKQHYSSIMPEVLGEKAMLTSTTLTVIHDHIGLNKIQEFCQHSVK